MIAEFRLPDLGEGPTEAEVVTWPAAPGDTVTLNQTLAEVETAKAVVELPSPYEGTVSTLHAEAGQTIAVGAPLIAFDVVGEEPDARNRRPTPPRRPSRTSSATALPPRVQVVPHDAPAGSVERGSRWTRLSSRRRRTMPPRRRPSTW